MARRCLVFGCGRFIRVGSRCDEHQRAHERARDRARGPRRDGALHSRWARLVKHRDGFVCRRCGSAEHVEAHHIRPLAEGGGYTLVNGITLCKEHHREAHRGKYGHTAKAG